LSVASRPRSAAMHFLALEWSLALGECGILRRKSAANAR